ncbi:MAG: hypothetical protein GXP16_15425 [Gammaproteobacteria bacterium]|nr:hypothetical protein [Gammaproteobacteria bacterium]
MSIFKPILTLLFCLGIYGCGNDTNNMPPGFLDEPPPPPTSETSVLSGGTLMLDPHVTDSVLVLQQGTIMAWGKRGEVDMPNDSIGVDMRGKWLYPGTLVELNKGVVKAGLRKNQPANMIILSQDPELGPVDQVAVVGEITQGTLRLDSPE